MGDHAQSACRLSAPPPPPDLDPIETERVEAERIEAERIEAERIEAERIEAERIEAGRRLFAQPSRFLAAAAEPAAMPAPGLPEIAFAGRSNVGKSSLVNALCGRRMLARTSNTPGRTRQINFFALGDRLLLVDLPGYGYARASKQAAAAWMRLVRRYLESRASLRRVCLLIDARHGIKEIDRLPMRLLDAAGVSYQIVLTKTDKAAAGALPTITGQIAEELSAHPAAHPQVHLTSARKGSGVSELRAALADLAAERT